MVVIARVAILRVMTTWPLVFKRSAATRPASVNAAVGYQTLYNNTEGIANTAMGDMALFSNTIGGYNTAYGNNTLSNSTTGSGNTTLGDAAGANLTTGNNNIDIGAGAYGVAGESNTIRIGVQGIQIATYVAGIRGVPSVACRSA